MCVNQTTLFGNLTYQSPSLLYTNVTGNCFFTNQMGRDPILYVPTVWVGGSVAISGVTSIGVLGMPLLISVSLFFNINSNYNLTIVLLPRLQFIGQYLFISFNTWLTYLSLPSLTYIGGSLQVYNSNSLQMLDFPSLVQISGCGSPSCIAVDIDSNTNLSVLKLPSLMAIGEGKIIICQNSPAFVIPRSVMIAWVGHPCLVANGTVSCSAASTICL